MNKKITLTFLDDGEIKIKSENSETNLFHKDEQEANFLKATLGNDIFGELTFFKTDDHNGSWLPICG